jgi:glycosyltransferase involved in cell wall biosynthesis
MTARLSVVIPSYNHELYIEQAIRSVLDQSVDGIELVIVDDGSSDQSVEVIRSVLDQYPDKRTQLIVQENRGAHAAIMRGIESSNGPIISILNSDDHYLSGRFESMLKHLEGQEFALAFSLLKLIDDDGKQVGDDHPWTHWYKSALDRIEHNPTLGFSLLEANCAVTSGNFVFTRAIYNELGGFSEHKFAHDWDFLVRSMWYTEPMLIREPLMAYRTHEGNTTERVRPLLEAECDEIIARYAHLCESKGTPLNPTAPHPSNWGEFFDRFVSTRKTFWNEHSKQHPIGQLARD